MASKYAKYREEWTQLYVEEEWSTYDIADEYDCDDGTVTRHLKAVGVEMRGSGNVTSAQTDSEYDKHREEMARMWLYDGLGSRKIGEEFDCSGATVERQLKLAGFEEFKARCYYRADETEQLFNEGWSLKQIGEEMHCSMTMVRELLIERGYDTSTKRSRGREMATEERFWKYVDKNADGECWLWTGARQTDGAGKKWHGVFEDDGPTGAHRFSYELHGGEIPEGKQVNHHCDVPHCVNPDHLYVGQPGPPLRRHAAGQHRRRYRTRASYRDPVGPRRSPETRPAPHDRAGNPHRHDVRRRGLRERVHNA